MAIESPKQQRTTKTRFMTQEQIKQKNTELFQLYHKARLEQLKIIDEMKKSIIELNVLKDCRYDFEQILNNQEPWHEKFIKTKIQDLFKESDNLFDQFKS